MSTVVPFLVIGITTGSVYALAAMGLTLTYRTTGIFNFSQGALGAAAAYIFYDLTALHEIAWPLAAVICVVVVGIGGGLLLERLGSVLARVDVSVQIVATVGLMVAIQSLIVVAYGPTSIAFPAFLPTDLHSIAGAAVSADQLIIAGVVLLLGLVLVGMVRFTALGIRTRAVVDDADLLALNGVEPKRVRRVAWIIGSTFATVAGILAAVAVGTLDPTLLTLLLINAFGAAALGAFRSLPLTYIGGLMVGIASALATKYITIGTGFLAGIPAAIPVIVLFIILLVLPRRRLVTSTTLRRAALPLRGLRPVRTQARFGVVAVAVLLLAPTIFGDGRLPALTATVVYAILLLSLIVLVKMSGQVSLCQYGLAAVGAAAFYQLAGHAGLPWPVAVIVAGLITIPVGALVAIPAIRLSGLFLALATLAFGILLQQLFYTSDLMFTQQPSVTSPRPGFAEGDQSYYYLTVFVLVLCALLVVWVERSRLGRMLRGMEQSPTTMVTHGMNINVTKVIVFSLSAFLAGIAGALYGPITGSLSAVSFDPLNSVTLLAILIVSGPGLLRPALLGGLGLSLIPSFITSATIVNYLPVLYGVSAIIVATTVASRSRGGKKHDPSSRWTLPLPSRGNPAPVKEKVKS
jgi:branched-subunit amino acid ABC-type transport system permease component